ncbi:hypothetical protein DIPPA_29530 [Diplonema papillatum]|nr:hypothetical protein DIPPA_29530 [Diplonema papillatum]
MKESQKTHKTSPGLGYNATTPKRWREDQGEEGLVTERKAKKKKRRSSQQPSDAGGETGVGVTVHELAEAEGGQVQRIVVVEPEIDDTGAPAHRAAAKIHRAQIHPHPQVTPPSHHHVNDDHNRLIHLHLPEGINYATTSLAHSSATHTRQAATTPPVLSRFEKALILGHRTKELALGAPTLAPFRPAASTGGWCPSQVAEDELVLGLLDDYCLVRSTHGESRVSSAESWILHDFEII